MEKISIRLGRHGWKTLVFIFFLSLLSLLKFRFPLGYSDQLYQIPLAYNILGIATYKNDFMLLNFLEKASPIYCYLLSFIIKYDPTTIITTFLLEFLFLISIYILAKQILKSHYKALIACIFSTFYCWSFVVDWGIQNVMPRVLVLPFIVLILIYCIKCIQKNEFKKFAFVFLSLGLLFNIHPISVIPIALFSALAYFIFNRLDNIQVKIGSLALFAFIFLLSASPNLILHRINVFPTMIVHSQDVVDILKIGAYWIFPPDAKDILHFLIASNGILLFGISWLFLKKKTLEDKILVLFTLFITAFGSLIYLFDYLHVFYFLNPHRALKFLFLPATLYASDLFYNIYQSIANRWQNRNIKVKGIISIIFIIFIFSYGFMGNAGVIISKSYENKDALTSKLIINTFEPIAEKVFGEEKVEGFAKNGSMRKENYLALEEVGEWISANTPMDSTFIVQKNISLVFRIYAKRGVVTDYSASIGVYSYSLAKEVQERNRYVDALYQNPSNQETLRTMFEKYHSNYILVEKSQEQIYLGERYKLLYENERYAVYEINMGERNV